MPQIPTLLEMLQAGLHFGHTTSRWHPKMAPFIHDVRNNVHIIDLEKTALKLAEALEYVKKISAEGKTILFLGTKPSAKVIIKREAERAGCPYLNERWFGGTLTNFEEISQLISRYRSYKQAAETGDLTKYTKKERLRLAKHFGKMDAALTGVQQMTRMPDALYIVDLRKEKTAVREAGDVALPVVAITDTNVDPGSITHPIPANDDAIKSIDMITRLVADAVLEGKAIRLEEEAKKAAAAKAEAAAQPAPKEQSRLKEEAPA